MDKEQKNEKAVHAQKLFDTIIKIRDSNGLDKESQKEFNNLVWECIVPYPKWKELFRDLVKDSKEPYLFDPDTLDANGERMLTKVYDPDLFDVVARHEVANRSKAAQQGELPPLDDKWFDRTVRDGALPLENAAAPNVTESLLTSVVGNEDLERAYARLNDDIPDSPSPLERIQARNLRNYNLADTLTPSSEEGVEMQTIIGGHPDLDMTILGNDSSHPGSLDMTIVHAQNVSTTDRLSSVAPKKATPEYDPKMQVAVQKLGKTMSSYMASTSQSNATPNAPNTPNIGKKHEQASDFKR